MTTTRHTAAVTDHRRKLAWQMDEWAPDGACRGDERFSDDSGDTRILKKICRECAVSVECLGHALQWPEPDGIWGGLDINERRKIRDNARNISRRQRKAGTV